MAKEELFNLIMTRKSVRTFDGTPISRGDRDKLESYVRSVPNPFGIDVDFSIYDAKENGLSSLVINGEDLYVCGKVVKQKYGELAFGYSFEKFVLYAWSLGIGTTWIGGTLDRKKFESLIGLKPEERMYAVSPLGYPSSIKSDVDTRLRTRVKGDTRLPFSDLFFDRDFSNPLVVDKDKDMDLWMALEAVRWYPSAANMQPCRIVRDGNRFHFYEHHTKKYDEDNYGDVQKLDMGIALCHFMSLIGGTISFNDPGIKTGPDIEYILTVNL